jgi:hypothetical protein
MSAGFGGDAGSGPVILAGDKDIAFVPAAYGPSGRWIAFALVKSVLLIYAGGMLAFLAVRSTHAGAGASTGEGLFALAALLFALAFFTLVHVFTRKVVVDAEQIEYCGGLGMTTRILRRSGIAGWRISMGREFNLEDMVFRTGMVTLYPSDPQQNPLSLSINAFDFDEDFDHWLATLPRIVGTGGGEGWEALLNDPMFAPLFCMVLLVYGCIVVLAALLVAKVV